MPHTFTVTGQVHLDVTAEISSEGLLTLAAAKTIRGNSTIIITHDLQDEEVVNFVALVYKCNKHVQFMLGAQSGPVQPRAQVWRRFYKNRVDAEHGEGQEFTVFLNAFLARVLPFLTLRPGAVVVDGHFESSAMAAAAAGRLVNMMRWAKQWTRQIKLISEAAMTWETFDKISVRGEQPVVRRRK